MCKAGILLMPAFLIGSYYTLTPSDGQYFSNISLNFTGGTTGVESTFPTDKYLKVYPKPSSSGNLFADIYLEQNSETTVSVFNLSNQLIFKKKYNLQRGSNTIDICGESHRLRPGNYLLLVENNHYTPENKLVVR